MNIIKVQLSKKKIRTLYGEHYKIKTGAVQHNVTDSSSVK